MSEPHPSCVYMVESFGWDTYELLAVYDNAEAALAHASHPSVVQEFGRHVAVTEIGVRSRLQIREPYRKRLR